jgi:hypothetical protein
MSTPILLENGLRIQVIDSLQGAEVIVYRGVRESGVEGQGRCCITALSCEGGVAAEYAEQGIFG